MAYKMLIGSVVSLFKIQPFLLVFIMQLMPENIFTRMSTKLTWLGTSEHTKFTSVHNFINSPYYHLFIMSSTEGITATSSLSSFITDHVTTHLRGCHCHVNSIYHCHHLFTCQFTLLSSSTSWHSKWGQYLTVKPSLWLSLFQAYVTVYIIIHCCTVYIVIMHHYTVYIIITIHITVITRAYISETSY